MRDDHHIQKMNVLLPGSFRIGTSILQFSTDLENVGIDAGTVGLGFLVRIHMTISVSHCYWLLCILGWTKSSL